jgi:hypothetical protein
MAGKKQVAQIIARADTARKEEEGSTTNEMDERNP